MKMRAGAQHQKTVTIARLMEMLNHAETNGYVAIVPYIEQAIRDTITR